MEVYINAQAIEALYAFILGAAAGVLYDLLAVLCGKVKAKINRVVLTSLFDLVFCVVLGVWFFMLGYGPGNGRLRLFWILFALPGTSLYFIFLSKPVTLALEYITHLIWLVIQAILFPFRMVCKFLKFLVKSIKNILQYLYKWFTIDSVYVVNVNGGENGKSKAKSLQRRDNPDCAVLCEPVADTGGKPNRKSKKRQRNNYPQA